MEFSNNSEMMFLDGERSELEERATKLIAERIGSLPKVVLGIVGGSSVSGIFALLINENIDWSKVHIFMVDERCVQIDSEESNFRGAYESFLRQLVAEGILPEKNIHPYRYDEGHLESTLTNYNEEFRNHGNKFDIVLLSAGEDGHIASLFPGHNSIMDEGDEFIAVEEAPKAPPLRISASRKLLERSGLGILLFFGDQKRKALKRFRDENISIKECPAKVVQSMTNAWVLTDI